MSAKENQAAAKQTFGFLHSLTNEYPAKQDGEHEVRIRELREIKVTKKTKRLRSTEQSAGIIVGAYLTPTS